MKEKIEVYLELGKKRVFAGALDWPGWCRSGRDEESALQALFDYRTRYAHAIQAARAGFQEPQDLASFQVKERLEGNTTTDFGAPAIAPSSDTRPVSNAELERFTALLEAILQTFDEAVQAASGKELRKGPRGGGRDVEKIVQHVSGAETGYLRAIGWKMKSRSEPGDAGPELALVRQAVLDGLSASARGELPAQGPRGAAYWTARYFVRRVAWHVLDHAWEIEDRIR